MKLLWIPVFLCTALCGAQLNAQIVLADNFDRTGDLNGSAPSTPQSSNPTETWTATSTGDFTLNSTGLLTSTGAETADGGTAAADLAFTLTAGNIYTLTATLDPTEVGSNDWLAFGFQGGSDVSTGAPYLGIAPWMLLRPGGAGTAFAGPDVAGPTNYSSTTGNLKLVLDTTGTAWTYTAYADGVAISAPVTYSTNPTIDHVFIEGYHNMTGTFSNFTLTTTPEPSSWILLVAGLGGLVLVTRRLRNRA